MTRKRQILISGTGCALADFIYTGVSFKGPAFQKYSTNIGGEGGLSPGCLIFTDDLERSSGCKFKDISFEISGGKKPAAFNVGGPSLVSLIHASQMLEDGDFEVKFYGISGDDKVSDEIRQLVDKTPINTEHYIRSKEKDTPYTTVFSDPDYLDGQGERTFVNHIGAAWNYSGQNIDESFYESDIVCLGGTALVPRLHSDLTAILKNAKIRGCLTVVMTVFDFINEKKSSKDPWPLVDTPEDFGLIDLLIMDHEESLRISGMPDLESAARFFMKTALGAFVITNGAERVSLYSNGNVFCRLEMISLPVYQGVARREDADGELFGDTTGCGDNFGGGIISSLARQLSDGSQECMDLVEAVSLGIASGGFACQYIGGTFFEQKEGEKRKRVLDILKDYKNQKRC